MLSNHVAEWAGCIHVSALVAGLCMQVQSEDDLERIQQVFQRATKDYLSVNIWSAYLK